MSSNKGGNQNPQGQHFHDSRNNMPHTNEKHQFHERDDTTKHQYQDYDQQLTNDENFDLNNPDGTDKKMDYRDRLDNLEAGKTD